MKNRYKYLIPLVILIGVFTINDYLKRITPKSPKTLHTATQVNETERNTPKVFIDDITIQVEISDTPILREQGLSNRESLGDNSGMLFVFGTYNMTYFWMKDMQFPLDIIWIKDDKIVDIDKNVPTPKPDTPLNQLPKYSPSEKVNYVLEVNAGFADTNDIKIGDSIKIEL
jgi:uncharacterized membrane protein (UPF0127 family)